MSQLGQCPDGIRQAAPVAVLSLTMRAAVLALASWPVAVLAQPSQVLGTLFFSEAERAAIVRQRAGPVEEVQRPPSVIKLTGVLVRNGGKGTAWVNGQPVTEGQTPFAGIPVAIQRGRISIQNQTVRPGETLDLGNRQRTDSLIPGLTITQPGSQPNR